MVGTPGAGYPWPPYSSPPSTHEGESQRAQFEAALSFLREQRAQIAAEIGEYLYGLVIQGQVRDPVVLATCRRLYDHEQQMAQLEASIRALPVASPPVGKPPGYTPIVAPGGPPGFAPGAFGLPGTNPPPTPLPPASDDDGATVIAPISRPARDAGSHDADATRVVPAASGAGDSHGSRSQSEGGETLVQRAVPASHDSQPHRASRRRRRNADRPGGEGGRAALHALPDAPPRERHHLPRLRQARRRARRARAAVSPLPHGVAPAGCNLPSLRHPAYLSLHVFVAVYRCPHCAERTFSVSSVERNGSATGWSER